MIERSAESLRDLVGHVLYLKTEGGPDVALRFVNAVEAALLRLEQFPYLGRPRNFRQKGLRSWAVPGFTNWILFYRPLRGGVRLYRVLHGSMDLESQL